MRTVATHDSILQLSTSWLVNILYDAIVRKSTRRARLSRGTSAPATFARDLPLMLRNPTRRFKLAIAIRYITVAINRAAGGNQGGTGSQVHPSILQ
jgi:hypothetical protein